jgi:hypothetical protein
MLPPESAASASAEDIYESFCFCSRVFKAILFSPSDNQLSCALPGQDLPTFPLPRAELSLSRFKADQALVQQVDKHRTPAALYLATGDFSLRPKAVRFVVRHPRCLGRHDGPLGHPVTFTDKHEDQLAVRHFQIDARFVFVDLVETARNGSIDTRVRGHHKVWIELCQTLCKPVCRHPRAALMVYVRHATATAGDLVRSRFSARFLCILPLLPLNPVGLGCSLQSF